MERNSKQILKRLQNEGWDVVKGGKGSHVKLKKDGFPMLIVPHPKKDLPTGTARNIALAVGWI